MGADAADLTVVDMAFAVSGEVLVQDHSFALWQALEAALPRLVELDAIAVLPIRAASAGSDRLVLNRRSRLLMRLPEASVAALLALCGMRLNVGGAAVEVGSAKTRALSPHATLYAHRVAAGSGGEASFVEEMRRDLADLGVRGDFVVGRRARIRGPEGDLTGYSLMLTDLSPRESLALQAAGLGAHRRLGFGVFVGHK